MPIDGEQGKHQQRTTDTELFADQREDEIGVRFRQKEHLLPTLAEPDAGETAGAEGDQRLHELKGDVLAVAPRIEEGENAAHAIRRIDDRDNHGRQRRQAQTDQMRRARAAAEEHQDEHQEQDGGGAEVRLAHDEQRAQPDDDQVRQDAEGELRHALAFPRDRARQVEHDGDLGELRRLQTEPAEPIQRRAPPRADADAGHQHQRQRHQGADQQRVGERSNHSRRTCETPAATSRRSQEQRDVLRKNRTGRRSAPARRSS